MTKRKKSVAEKARAWESDSKKDAWHTGDDHKDCVAEDCSFAKKFDAGVIFITTEVYTVIRKLCEEVKTEWQMLLKGTEDEITGNIHITGYYIPKQEVSYASVKNTDCIDKKFIEENNIIATIHSHASMGCFFSVTDEEFTNMSTIPNHIVVNNDGEHKACVKWELPCGLVKFFETKVKVDHKIPDIEIDGKDNITQRVYNAYNKGKTYHKNFWDEEDEKEKKKGKGKEKRKKYLLDDNHVSLYGYAGGYGIHC